MINGNYSEVKLVSLSFRIAIMLGACQPTSRGTTLDRELLVSETDSCFLSLFSPNLNTLLANLYIKCLFVHIGISGIY